MKKMLIFLHDASFDGGASRSFLDVLPMLANNFDIHIVAPYGTDEFKEYCYKFLVQDKYFEIKRHFWYADKNKVNSIKKKIKKLFYYPINYFQLKKIKKHFGKEFDIVYSNSLAIQLGCEYAMKNNIPHVWHVREFMYEDHGRKFLNESHVYKKLFPYSNAIYITKAISYCFCDYFKQHSIVIKDFVDFTPIEKKNHDCIVYGFIGTISESKGQRYAIEAFNRIKKDHPKSKLIIVGNGPDELFCKALVQKYELEESVSFLGHRKDINEILSGVDCLLVCSKHEALGRVTIEGMFSKSLVIGANTGGTKELLEDYRGLLYEYGDIDDLYRNMNKLFVDFEGCAEVIDNAYKYVIKEFSYDSYKKSYIDFLMSI